MNLDAIVNSGLASLVKEPHQWLLYNKQFAHLLNNEMFDSDYWQNQNAVTGSAQGRGTTYFVKCEGHDWVLRHYYRGGLIGKLIHDSYLYTGINNTRAVKEHILLSQLEQWKLPAPRPVACRIRRSGLSYRADIISERINNAEDLYTRLLREPVTDELWQRIGKTIAAFHQKGVYHHDLNIHNILLDDKQQVWLIDFDQGEIRSGGNWQQANMARLLRSFHKEKTKHPAVHWQDAQWQLLEQSYQQTLK
ncbi:3-deoxy-D-manno-octulosonic acid kinase [Thalassotalea euphylliae]|uniref:3-deoxy-D-manno-octulosonic acid kinase n=1 Tax=Thalassotalea euphylliae TaxID=1655234 RepID=UPI001FEC2D27|nr:3-deoxy-D-manno-octulosonic acid kinase [Thalassotalea euphylliae]